MAPTAFVRDEGVTASATEDEHMAAERVRRERGLHHRRQTVEALAHVGVAGNDPHPRPRRKPDHAIAPSS